MAPALTEGLESYHPLSLLERCHKSLLQATGFCTHSKGDTFLWVLFLCIHKIFLVDYWKHMTNQMDSKLKFPASLKEHKFLCCQGIHVCNKFLETI